MRLLLDTNAFFWAMGDPRRLRPPTRAVISDAENDVVVSAVSIWEAVLKRARGGASFDPGDLLAKLDIAGFARLPITHDHAVAAGALPAHHNDPFDRMLVAQAQVEQLTLVTSDAALAAYDVSLLPA